MDLEKFKNNNQIYKLIFDRSPLGLFIYDKDLVIRDFNDRFVKILEGKPEILKDLDMHSLKDQRIISALKDALEGKYGFYNGNYKATNTKADIWVELKTLPLFDDNNKIIAAVGLVEDLTEKKKFEDELKTSEEKYKFLIENMNDVVYSVDNEGVFTYVSPVIKNISGYEQEEVLGHNFMKFVHPFDLPGLLLRFAEMKATGRQSPQAFRIKGKDGREVYIQTHSRPTIKDGKTIGINGIMSDITERKKYEEELKKKNEELEKVNKLMTGRELKMIEMKKKMREAGLEV